MLAVVLAVVSPSAGVASTGCATRTYHDSIGEDGAAADIGRVTVSSDRRLVTFSIQIVNRPRYARDMAIQILLDTDQNPGTGSAHLLAGSGVDDIISVFPDYAGLARWNPHANSFDGRSEPAFSYRAGQARVAVPARQLGNPTGFNFAVSTSSGIVDDGGPTIDLTNAHFDFAPDPGHGAWTYRTSAANPR